MAVETKTMYLTEEKFLNYARQMNSYRFIEAQSIAPMNAMPGELDVDGVYCGVPEKIEGSQIAIGDEFVGRDRYLWAQKTIVLPEHIEGREVYGMFDFGKTGGGHNSGFESLLYVDGHPYQGVDTNHNDVNFESLAGKTVTLTFMLWTGLEGGGPKREFRHRIQQADIGYLHTATDEFYYLFRAAAETYVLLHNDDPTKFALAAALDRALKLVDWDCDCFYDTIGDALECLKAELVKLKKESDITINVVGHTHIDVAWLWRLKHTREKAQRSFSTVLKLMEEFPEYIFMQGQPQLYEYIKKDNPELYEKMKARIAEGRWEADGGMWLEADCNISSGEALIRQFLYGMGLVKKEFGHKCEYLWLPDVFGYSWALPQILRGVGIDTFMTTKISWNQYNTMPHDLFKWRGMDGSEVMTYFITTPEVGGGLHDRFSTYNGLITPHSTLGSWTKFRDKQLSHETLLSYGYGDGGGGVNRDMLKMRRALEQVPGLPNVKTDRAGNFFKRMHENIENTDQYVHTWDGELYLEYHRGTYTSQGYNKMMNRRLEFALAECEWLSEMAKLAGGEYDQETLVRSWQTVLRHQFHDIIPGSSITEVYQDSRKEYGETADDLRAVAKNALDTLSKPEKDAYTLWHFGSFARKDVVFIAETREGEFTDNAGHALNAQKVENGYWVEVAMPAMAATTIRFAECAVPVAANPFDVDMAAGTIATPYYKVEWNEDGHFTRLYDVENSREVIPAGAKGNVLEVYEDKPVAHDNWDIDLFYLFKHEVAKLVKAPELIECGALRTVIRFAYSYRHSSFVQDVIFYADNRRIDFKTWADWHEDHRVLKAAFPVTIRNTKATYEIQYGHVERPTHFNTSWDFARFEVVAQRWADLSEEGYGVSLLNDCKYGHNIKDNVMHVTLLKAGKYPDTECDMGEHNFTYALLPHAGSVVAGDTIEEAVKLNLPVRAMAGAAMELPTAFVANSRSVAIDAVKKCEEDDCLVVRIHECRGAQAEVELVPGFTMKAYAPCNLLEEQQGEWVEASTIKTVLRPFQIQTFKVKTEF